MGDEWVTVGSRNRPKRHHGLQQAGQTSSSRPPQQPSDRPPTAVQLARWCALVAEARSEVAASAFFRNLAAVLARASLPLVHVPAPLLGGAITHLVVWGLGSLDSGLAHIRYQLALAQLLQQSLAAGAAGEAGEGGGPGGSGTSSGSSPGAGVRDELRGGASQAQQQQAVSVEAFDPVFSALDRAVLGACGIEVTARNPQGRHIAAAPTLFWLPHCELELTEALLSANVAAGTLCHVAILGNSFGLYCERWELAGGRARRKEAPPLSAQPQQPDWQGSLLDGESAGTADKTIAVLAQPEGLLFDLCRCGATEELAVSECGFPVSSAFNDMALHVFAADWRERLARQRGI